MLNRVVRKFSYDSNTHSLLGKILCFRHTSTNQMSYGIHMEEDGELLLIDPLEAHIPEYLTFMDEKNLKIGHVALTSEFDQFEQFYCDLRFVAAAWSENFKIHTSF